MLKSRQDSLQLELPSAGQAITLNMNKPVRHTVIVLVSRDSDHSLFLNPVSLVRDIKKPTRPGITDSSSK